MLKALVFGFSAFLAVFSAQADTLPVKTWNLTLKGAGESPTKSVINSLQAAVNTRCSSLTSADSVSVVWEYVLHEEFYGGQETALPNAECENDLPCNTSGPTVGGYILRSSDIRLIRAGGGRSYEIQVTTWWDFDLPVPTPKIELQSSSCL